MKKLILIFFGITISCLIPKEKNSENSIEHKIDIYLSETIKTNQIPGLAVAVIKNGKVIYERYYGKSSLEENSNVDKNSIFRLYSTTKIFSVVGVFQLIEKQQLSLEDKISKYLDNLPKEWQDVKIKYLVTHSSGIPDIVKFDDIPYSMDESEKWSRLYKKPMEFETGSHYSYNQTNFCLLSKIIEKISGSTFEEYILANQFPSVENGVVFSANSSEEIPNRVSHHIFNKQTNKYERLNADHGKIHNSGSGLNITLKEFIAWNERLDNNTLLSKASKKAMWSPFQYMNSEDSFLYGWESYETNKVKSLGFTGSYMTAFRKFVDNDLTIIFLSNGFKDFHVESQAVDHIASIVDEKLLDKDLLANEKITADFHKKDIVKAKQNFEIIKSQNPNRNFENILLTVAYDLMNNGRLKEAIHVFELNVKEYPSSANAYDCVAEAYFANGQYELSKQNYQKSFDLFPGNTNAKNMVDKINKITKK